MKYLDIDAKCYWYQDETITAIGFDCMGGNEDDYIFVGRMLENEVVPWTVVLASSSAWPGWTSHSPFVASPFFLVDFFRFLLAWLFRIIFFSYFISFIRVSFFLFPYLGTNNFFPFSPTLEVVEVLSTGSVTSSPSSSFSMAADGSMVDSYHVIWQVGIACQTMPETLLFAKTCITTNCFNS